MQHQLLMALRIHPALEFDRVPGFWDLPREGNALAVEALASLGMAREAARLEAIIERRFRPRLVTTRPNRGQFA